MAVSGLLKPFGKETSVQFPSTYKSLILLTTIPLMGVGCAPGDEGPGDHHGPDDGPGSGPSGPDSGAEVELRFHVSSAQALIATEAAEQTQEIRLAHAEEDPPKDDEGGGDEGGSNFMAVDSEGSVTPAADSNYPIRVMYSVMDPAGEYVYVALDPGWFEHGGGEDYSRVIAMENCAFFRVSLADDSFECVMQGVIVQPMDETYMQNVSGNQKPVQFDASSNVYFAGTEFQREEDSWTDCCDEEGNEYVHTEYWLHHQDWNPQVYRLDRQSGELEQLTQDNARVEFFLALSTGELAYQSRNDMTGQATLKLWQNGQTIQLSDDGWGVNFFTADSHRSIIWGAWDASSPGLFFARPLDGGLGAEKTKLNTELFGAGRNGEVPTMRRALVGDDGRLYGVFESWRWDEEEGNSEQVLTVYQVLPFDPVPKVQLSLSSELGWWEWFGRMPFQVAQGYLYYTEPEEVPFLGTRDVIRMVNLETRHITTVLDQGTWGDEEIQRYELYNWRLSGDTLFFSGQDLSTTSVVTGEIDTSLVRESAEDPAALEITETESATASFRAIQDIEVLRAPDESTDPGVSPTVAHRTHPENLYSMSLEFSEYMDETSVEDSLSIIGDPEGSADSIGAMKVWIEKTLHLIPDLSAEGDLALGDSQSSGLLPDTEYEISLAGSVFDRFGNALDAASASASFLTRPDFGWYSGATDSADAALSDGAAARFAGPAGKTYEWDYILEAYELDAFTVPENIQIELSARNIGSSGIHVLLWNDSEYVEHYENPWEARSVSLRLGDWGHSNLEYMTEYSNGWQDSPTPEIFSGTWMRYRIRIFGDVITVEYTDDGVEYTEIAGLAVDDPNLRDRAGDDLKLYLGVAEAMLIDDVEITALDAGGTATMSLLSEDFTDTDVAGFFGEPVDAQTLGL